MSQTHTSHARDLTHPLESLLQKHCPNGVEFKTLGEVCENLPKGTLKTSQLEKNGYPVINSGRDLYGYYSQFNNDGNALTIAARGEYAGFVNFMDSKFWAGGLCYPYRSNDENALLTKFIFYYLKASEANIMKALVARGSIPAINKSDCDKIKIPLPPLAVQEKIVEILDTFTELQRELQRELHARRKQYEYYRNTLLSFEELQKRTDSMGGTMSLVCLGEVCEVGDGLHGTPNYIDFSEYKFINGNNLSQGKINIDNKTKCISKETYQKLKINFIAGKTIFMSINGTIGNLAFYNNEKIALGKSVAYLNNKLENENLNTSFLYYFLNCDKAQDYFKRNTRQGTICNLGLKELRNFEIPLPPLPVQNEIVEILDKFDALVNDLVSGIPAEIEARKKQYEYYREQLLSFKEID